MRYDIYFFATNTPIVQWGRFRKQEIVVSKLNNKLIMITDMKLVTQLKSNNSTNQGHL